MPTKVLIIIDNPNMVNGFMNITLKEQFKDLDIIAFGKDVEDRLKKKGLPFKTPCDYGISEEFLKEEGLMWFRLLPHIDLKYDEISLWWMIEQPLYCSRFAYPCVMNIIMQTITLNRIIKSEKPSRLYYLGKNASDTANVKMICKTCDIDLVDITSTDISLKVYQHVRAFAYVAGQWARILLRKTYWILLNRRYKSFNTDKKLLLFSPAVWTNIRDLQSGELKQGDPHLDSIVEQLKKECLIIDIDVPSGDWGLKIMHEKTQQKQMVFKSFESYLSLNMFIKAFKEAKKLHRQFNSLKKSEDFEKFFRYNGMPVYKLIIDNTSLFFSTSYMAMMIAYIEMAKHMISSEKPSVIIHYGDLPDSGRAVFALAEAENIPTLLLQHGLYDIYSPYFNHIKTDNKDNKTDKVCPIPDIFAVSDNYTRDILINRGNFPEQDIIITGQPRYDIMASKEMLDKDRVFETLNLDPAKKLSVWMTATHAFSRKENEEYINCIYDAIRRLDDVQLLIKLHPGEKQKATLYRKNKTIEPAIVNKYNLTTFELLNAADTIITNGYCSTAIEAIILDKPVITMDFKNNPLPPYVKYGASIGVFNSESLLPILKDILGNENTCNRMAISRKKFIGDFGYNNDGKATQRVVDLIRDMMKNKQRSELCPSITR